MFHSSMKPVEQARGPAAAVSPFAAIFDMTYLIVVSKFSGAACEWTAGETKLMLDYYEQYFAQVGPMKKFRNKKEMFARIAENLNKTMGITRTGEQCCSRFKTVIRRKTSATTNNKKSGNSPSDVPYDEELAKIAAQDDSLEPEELRDGHGVVSRKDTGSMSSRKGRSSGEVETPDEETQSSQSSQSTSSSGQSNTAEKQKTRPPRPSTSRLQDMKFFLDEMKQLQAQKEAQRVARHEERKKQKEESRQERARQHNEKMALLSRALGISADYKDE